MNNSLNAIYNFYYLFSFFIKFYYYNRLCKFNEASPDDCDPNSPRRKLIGNDKRYSRTITDPCYPVFRCDGLPVSQSLYEQYIASHCEELRDDGGDNGIHGRCNDNDNLQSRNLSSDLMSAKLSINSSSSSITRDAGEGT